jgi:hypothetical protein
MRDDVKPKCKEQMMEKLTPKEVAKQVSLMLNCFGNRNKKEFIEEMGNEHRTIQQQFTQLSMDWLSHCDGLKDTGKFDGRNEKSVELANHIYDLLEEEEVSYNRKYILPFI